MSSSIGIVAPERARVNSAASEATNPAITGQPPPADTGTSIPPEKKKREYRGFEEHPEKAQHAKVDMDAIQLTAGDLYDKEKVDLETVEVGDVLQLLQCDEGGLTSDEAERRLGIFGPNKLEETSQNPILQFLSFMWNPLSWVMEMAAVVAIILSNGQGSPPDWEDFVGIITLLFVNSAIGFYEERNAGNAVKALMDALAPKAKVRRDGQWLEIESAHLVPGDIVSFKIGDIVPADCRLLEAVNVSIDQAALTGESLPQTKTSVTNASRSTCKQGEAEGVVISTGANTFFGRAATLVGQDDDTTGHLQRILAYIGSFCLVTIGIFVIAEIFVLYAGFRYQYRRGLNNILVLLIGGIPIAMPTVLSVTLAVGATQLAKHKAIVTRITAIEELAGVTILCSDKTGTLTTNKLTIDRSTIKTYSTFSADQVILLAAYASRTENQDAIDLATISALDDPKLAREGIKLLDFKPFNPVDKRTEITYREEGSGKLKRVTKGMTGIIIELCTRNKTEEQEDRLEHDVEDYATRGLRALAVASEEIAGESPEAEGNGFELIGLLSIFDPPRSDTKQTIDDAQALGVKVKMVTGDQLAIAKETGRRLGLGDHMYPAKVLKDGPGPDSKFKNLDAMIMDADGFAGVFPEHKYEIVKRLQGLGHLCAMTGDGANDAPALSRANVGIAVEGATDAARGAADIVLTEPGLSTIIHAIRQSRIIFQRMRNYSIYACAVTIRIVVCFAVLAFTYKFDFPPFMILVVALLNDGTIMTLSLDRVLPSSQPDAWNLPEIFAYAVAYGIYLTASTIALVVVIIETNFFERTFGVSLAFPARNGSGRLINRNDPQLHMIVYLQVAIISQALIFVTRSHGFFFMERPSFALLGAFAVAQLVSSIIAAYGNWGFTDIQVISGGWIGIVWVWNLIWFVPLDWIKFAMRATIIKKIHERGERKRAKQVAEAAAATADGLQRSQSRAQSVHDSLYRNRVSFLRRTVRRFRAGSVSIKPEELQRFSSISAQRTGATLARHPTIPKSTKGVPISAPVTPHPNP
ncbi:plasma membrane H(+)-ATPase 1 [Coprinopsis sp. MPI-PUGE-AT-0042]|nr:plasma membrane H(+)-ATPase 1 [Coprinopsis sp. MPI-PUGE-AT-0042]